MQRNVESSQAKHNKTKILFYNWNILLLFFIIFLALWHLKYFYVRSVIVPIPFAINSDNFALHVLVRWLTLEEEAEEEKKIKYIFTKNNKTKNWKTIYLFEQYFALQWTTFLISHDKKFRTNPKKKQKTSKNWLKNVLHTFKQKSQKEKIFFFNIYHFIHFSTDTHTQTNMYIHRQCTYTHTHTN